MDNPQPKPPSFGTGHFLFAILLAIIIFLLGESMVQHLTGHPHRPARTSPYWYPVNPCTQHQFCSLSPLPGDIL